MRRVLDRCAERRALARIGGLPYRAAVRRGSLALLLAMLCSALAGSALTACGGASFQGGVYRDREARYRVGELGSGWTRLALGDDNDLAFRNAALGAIVQVNASCDPDSDVPLTALTNHLLIGFTERDVRAQELLPMDGREALRTHVVARLDGVPRELLFYVLKKDDCVYDFALVAVPGSAFEAARPAFEGLVSGFTTEVPGP